MANETTCKEVIKATETQIVKRMETEVSKEVLYNFKKYDFRRLKKVRVTPNKELVPKNKTFNQSFSNETIFELVKEIKKFPLKKVEAFQKSSVLELLKRIENSSLKKDQLVKSGLEVNT